MVSIVRILVKVLHKRVFAVSNLPNIRKYWLPIKQHDLEIELFNEIREGTVDDLLVYHHYEPGVTGVVNGGQVGLVV